MSSNELCKACTLLEGLERGMAKAAVVRKSTSHNGVSSIHVSVLDGSSQEEIGRRWPSS